MRSANSYSKLGDNDFVSGIGVGKSAVGVSKSPCFSRGCHSNWLCMSGLPSDRREALGELGLSKQGGEERKGGWGEKTICELAPFEIATALLLCPGSSQTASSCIPLCFAVSECHCRNLRSFKEPLFVHRE